MIKQTRFLLFLILLLLGFTFTGCAKNRTLGITYNSGIEIYPEDIKKLTLGLSKTEVINLIGSATFTGITDSSTWYYVYQKSWYIAVFKEKLIDQQILILSFDKNNLLTKIQTKTIQDAKNPKVYKQNTKLYYKKSYITPDLF